MGDKDIFGGPAPEHLLLRAPASAQAAFEARVLGEGQITDQIRALFTERMHTMLAGLGVHDSPIDLRTVVGYYRPGSDMLTYLEVRGVLPRGDTIYLRTNEISPDGKGALVADPNFRLLDYEPLEG